MLAKGRRPRGHRPFQPALNPQNALKQRMRGKRVRSENRLKYVGCLPVRSAAMDAFDFSIKREVKFDQFVNFL
jgi:hypothetical protein